MWRTRLTEEQIDAMAIASRLAYYDVLGEPQTKGPGPKSLEGWRTVVCNMLDTAQTIGIVPTEEHLAAVDVDALDRGVVRVAIDDGVTRTGASVALGEGWQERHGAMAAYYAEVTIRKVAEIVTRKAVETIIGRLS